MLLTRMVLRDDQPAYSIPAAWHKHSVQIYRAHNYRSMDFGHHELRVNSSSGKQWYSSAMPAHKLYPGPRRQTIHVVKKKTTPGVRMPRLHSLLFPALAVGPTKTFRGRLDDLFLRQESAATRLGQQFTYRKMKRNPTHFRLLSVNNFVS